MLDSAPQYNYVNKKPSVFLIVNEISLFELILYCIFLLFRTTERICVVTDNKMNARNHSYLCVK